MVYVVSPCMGNIQQVIAGVVMQLEALINKQKNAGAIPCTTH